MTVSAELAEETRGSTVPSVPLLSRILRRPLALISLSYLVVLVACSLAASLVAPYPPDSPDFTAVLSGPSLHHLLGTDSLGRDVLSRLIYASAGSIGEALLTVAVAVVLAAPAGVLAGLYRDRWPDLLTSRFGDLLLAVPGIIVLLMVLAYFSSGMVPAMIALGVLSAPGVMRVVRGSAISVGEEPYIAAARVSGVSTVRIAMRHVLPRVTGPLVVNLSLVAAGALLAEAGLNFLGLGFSPPAPTWGGMVADASSVMSQQPWLLIPTGGVVALTVVAFVLIGDAVRDASTERWSGASAAARPRTRRASAPAAAPATHPVGTAAHAARRDGDPPAAGDVFGANLPELGPGRAADAVIEARHVTIAFPPGSRGAEWVNVVQDLSFAIGRGESLGLVGESGCGKTITGLALLDLLPAGARVTGGQITVNGTATAGMTGRQRAALRGSVIGFVAQEPMAALDPLFTVGFQVTEAVRAHSRLARQAGRRRALELLDLVRIPDPRRVAGLYPHQISGGMAQRVAIAIALAGSPELLIADEPTTALDVTVQAEILQLLADLRTEAGLAMLLISHDWGVVAQLCERCVVMYAGEAVEYGRTAEILASPLHPYSEGLLAANPHSAVPGQPLASIPGTVPPPGSWLASCHFMDRCRYSAAECKAPIPLAEVQPRRLTRCVRSHLITTGGESGQSAAPAGRA